MIVEQLQERSHMEDEELYEQIDGAISRKGREIFLSLKERLWLRNSLYDSFRRLDILQELLDDNEVTEIMVNGAGKVFLERGEKLCCGIGGLIDRNSLRILFSRSWGG